MMESRSVVDRCYEVTSWGMELTEKGNSGTFGVGGNFLYFDYSGYMSIHLPKLIKLHT